MHQSHSQRPETCSKARLQGLRLCAPVLLTLVFGGWLLKEASAAAGREYTWLNHAAFGERTTGFWLQTRHVCDAGVSASGLALTIRGYTWLSVGLKLQACWRRSCLGGVPRTSAASRARSSFDHHANAVTRCHTSYICVDTLPVSCSRLGASVPCFMSQA